MTRSIHRAFVALLVLLSMLLAVPAGAAAAQGNPNKPFVEDVDVTLPAPNLTAQCGFPVTVRITGTITWKVLPNGVALERWRVQHTFIGPGGSVTVNRMENVTYSFSLAPDGSDVLTITASGRLMYHNIQRGHGAIANNNGREVFQITWELNSEGELVEVESFVFDAGATNELSQADYDLICSKLA